VAEASAIRLLTFRSETAGPVLDVALRDEVVPALDAMRGVVDIHAGRHVASAAGARILVTTWATRAAMAAALGAGEVDLLLRDHADAIEDERTETFDLAFGLRLDRDLPANILRIVRGTTGAGELAAYVEERHARGLRDAQTYEGMLAVYVGIEPPTSFVTVSVWADWASIERSTGATVHNPGGAGTAGLEASATHYEILPPAAPSADRSELRDLTRGR
jgi:hypothetical protein